MKKTFTLVFIFCSFVFNQILFSQFESDTRLTNNPASKYKCLNNACGIASSGNYVHVVWSDFRVPASNEQIFYKRSSDGGITWGPDVQLTNVLSSAGYPSILAVGLVLHVVWHDLRSGGPKVFYKRSTDNGSTWTPDIQLSFGTTSDSRNPSIAISNSIIHVAWQDNRDGNYEIYYARSTNAGATWQQESRLTNNLASSQSGSICALGSVAHLVWSDNRDGNTEIYYKRSSDNGASWTPDTRLTNDPSESVSPSISVSDSVLYIVWQDFRSGGWDIYGKSSFDKGLTWGNDTRLTNNPYNQFYPSIIASGTNLHVTWQDVRDGNWEIYYKRSLNKGSTWETDTRLTNSAGDSYYPSVTVNNTAVDILWQDNRDGNFEMYFKRNLTGNPIGIKKISREVPRDYSLSQNYPNPFNPATNIVFQVPKLSNVKIVVFDILGREIQTLVDEKLNAGTYSVNWETLNNPSGVYFYKLQAGDFTSVKKMMMIK